MTVSDLIKELQQYDPNAEARVWCPLLDMKDTDVCVNPLVGGGVLISNRESWIKAAGSTDTKAPAGEMVFFYNKCQACGNTEISLVDDVNHEISKAGGIRAICLKCGRHTAAENWNQYNPAAGPVEPVVV